MSRVVAVWELGAGLGHIDRLLGVASALRARGHDVRFLLRDLSRAHLRLAAEGWWFAQAPLWLPKLANPPQLRSYTAVLGAAGWLDPAGLAGLLSAWRALFDVLQPDLILCDHAPTAMLAARGSGVPVLGVGNSFELPPLGDAFSAMAYWDPAEQARCKDQDALLLAPANEALARLGSAALGRLPELFEGVQRLIMSLPELSHYPDCAAAELVGPSFVNDSGLPPVWPAGDGPRLFAYLSPTHAQFERLMLAIKALGWPALVFASGLSAEAAARLGSATLRLSAQPLRMDAVLASARIAISHASMGTVTAAALAGVPQLVLPQQMEQTMVARRITQAGLGLAVHTTDKPADWPTLLRRLANEPGFAAAAAALAQRHAGATPQAAAERVADQIEARLAAR